MEKFFGIAHQTDDEIYFNGLIDDVRVYARRSTAHVFGGQSDAAGYGTGIYFAPRMMA